MVSKRFIRSLPTGNCTRRYVYVSVNRIWSPTRSVAGSLSLHSSSQCTSTIYLTTYPLPLGSVCLLTMPNFTDVCRILVMHALVLQDDIQGLLCWSIENRLRFNQSKCKVLSITKKKSPLIYPYKLDNDRLLVSDAQVDLGITISPKLLWNDQVNKVRSKAYQMLGFHIYNLYAAILVMHPKYGAHIPLS